MTVNPADSEVFGDLFGTAAMRELFADRHRFQAMLDVEAALARAQARLGIVPAAAAEAIARAARAEALDLKALGERTRLVGYPVVALVKALEQAAGEEGAGWVHWGATTQDIMDTGLVLQMRRGLALVEAALLDLARALAARAERHRGDVMAGRTHLQHALPITFGYKCAVWLAPVLDHVERLRQLRPRVEVVQLGGAVGTLAALGDQGRAVAEALAAELGLGVPDAPWHAARERVAEVAAFLGLVTGTLAKLATDVILLMQTELGEVAEPHQKGRGGSSTMPQKRNPIASEYVIAAARGVQALVPQMLGAMAGDQERASGPWQSELIALPQIFVLSSGALAHAIFIAEGMVVDTARMRRNLEATHGMISAEAVMMALGPKTGRGAAHHLVEEACAKALAEDRPLAEILAADARVAAHLDDAALRRLLAPENYLGEADAVIARVLARAREVVSPIPPAPAAEGRAAKASATAGAAESPPTPTLPRRRGRA
jgi:3-carboxy-cis,cis-muconate cycloisomerase